MPEAMDKARYWLIRDMIPVTKSLIVINLLTFLLIELFHMNSLIAYLGYFSTGWVQHIWTAFTYPLLGCGGVLCLLFSLYWLWIAAGSLERSWGSINFAVFFFVISAITAAALTAGGYITGIPVELVSLLVPLAAVTVAFGMLNPEEEIRFMLLIPLRLKYVALISVILLFIDFGRQHLLLGVFSLAGCAVAYWYVRSGKRLGLGRGYRPSKKDPRVQPLYPRRWLPNPLRWYRKYRDRKWLRKFLGE